MPDGRTESLRIRLSPDEKALVKRKAKLAGLSVSDVFRNLLALSENTEARKPPAERVIEPVDFEQRVKQLHARGLTTPSARRQAYRELQDRTR